MSLKTFRLDPWGDLTLRIGPDGEAEDYIVDPRALARASPVFERMLYGDFAEGNQSAGEAIGGWTVRLPDDNPWTMGRFLSTMHGKYDESLGVLSIDEIYDLILVAHYYDAIKLLQPWAGAWLDHVKSLTEDVHAPPLKMLWIAWELGSVPLVHEICRCIVLEFDAADFANALGDANVQTPPGVLEHLKSAREEILFSLLQPLRDLVDQLLVVDESPRWCRHAVWMGPHRCESIILGSLVFSLSRAQLWPLPEIADTSDQSHNSRSGRARDNRRP
ncbi:hypothetical protein BJ166DRAFT_629301 [Pestalotiopsis sp. NC0098]|nr:hypothetical protein BJ166DRAFT_629301 [Pestalotiopsis sp. NC0098]